jgi:hypothetical protein
METQEISKRIGIYEGMTHTFDAIDTCYVDAINACQGVEGRIRWRSLNLHDIQALFYFLLGSFGLRMSFNLNFPVQPFFILQHSLQLQELQRRTSIPKLISLTSNCSTGTVALTGWGTLVSTFDWT